MKEFPFFMPGKTVYNIDFACLNQVTPDTEYSSPLVALKNGIVYPTTMYIGKSYGIYIVINGEKYHCSGHETVYPSQPVHKKGYKILHPSHLKITELIKKDENYITSCNRGIELATQRIASYRALQNDYPELFI